MSDSTWDLASGLPDDFDGVITDAQFTYDQKYKNGTACICKLTMYSAEEGEQTQFYSIGADWEPADRGAKARYIGAKKPKVNNKSNFGLFITRAKELTGDSLRTRGDATEAKTWIGLEFHWEQEDYIDFQGVQRSRLLPSKLLGGNSSVSSNGNTAIGSAVSADVPLLVSADVPLPAKIKTALMRAAAESESHESFVEKAMSLDGVTDEMRPAILSTRDGSIWATMNG